MKDKELIDFLCEENEAFAKDLADGHDLIATFNGHFVAWDEIIEHCGNGMEGYSQSPLELISRIINERDELKQENMELSQHVCSDCDPENYGWIFNRVEGKAACGCMTEAEPFQILMTALEQIMRFPADDPTVAYKLPPEDRIKKIATDALKSVLPLDYAESV